MSERKFRWAVGDPVGRQAPPWTLRVGGSEFTLVIRAPQQRWHISFHESGERHLRFEPAAFLGAAGGPNSARDLDVWQAPDPVGGVVTEFMLIVPTTELRLPAAARRTSGITWIPAAPFGEAVRIVIGRQPAGGKLLIGLWTAPLASGEEVVVARVSGPLNAEEKRLLERARRRLAEHADDARSFPDPSGFEWGHAQDRTRFWMVVASP